MGRCLLGCFSKALETCTTCIMSQVSPCDQINDGSSPVDISDTPVNYQVIQE